MKSFNTYIIVPTIPVPNIIDIALIFSLYFLSKNNETPNSPNSIIWKSLNWNEEKSAWKRASINIETPAEPINATTAGLSELNTVWTPLHKTYKKL